MSSRSFKSEISTEDLLSKIHYIQSSIDENFRLILNKDWKASETDYRLKIRKFIETQFTSHFSREQMALLNDLNWIPQAQNGFLSISHCRTLGGFCFSSRAVGFDVEEMRRISKDILKRTCSEEEYNTSLKPEFLWVAKEAALKAHSKDKGYTRSAKPLIITDFVTTKWDSHFENKVFSFRLKSEKALDFDLNKGFIFSEGDELFCIYFK